MSKIQISISGNTHVAVSRELLNKASAAASLVSVSKGKGKKSKNPRSAFLSEFMKRAAGDEGNAMAEAFVGGDVDKFKSHFMKIQHGMVQTMSKSDR